MRIGTPRILQVFPPDFPLSNIRISNNFTHMTRQSLTSKKSLTSRLDTIGTIGGVNPRDKGPLHMARGAA